MSAAVLELGASQHHGSLALQHSCLLQEGRVTDSTLAQKNREMSMEDIIGNSEVQPSTSSSHERETKKKGFSLKKTAKTVVSGIKLKKKLISQEKSISHGDLSKEDSDLTPSKGKLKQLFNNLPNPSTKINKMWNSLSKTFSSSQNEAGFVEVGGSKSTMTLGRIYGRKKSDSAVKEDRKAYTLGRMFHFKIAAKDKTIRVSEQEATFENEKTGA